MSHCLSVHPPVRPFVCLSVDLCARMHTLLMVQEHGSFRRKQQLPQSQSLLQSQLASQPPQLTSIVSRWPSPKCSLAGGRVRLWDRLWGRDWDLHCVADRQTERGRWRWWHKEREDVGEWGEVNHDMPFNRGNTVVGTGWPRGFPGSIKLVANSHVENVYWPVFQLIELAFMQIRLCRWWRGLAVQEQFNTLTSSHASCGNVGAAASFGQFAC